MKKCLIVLAAIACVSFGSVTGTPAKTTEGNVTQDTMNTRTGDTGTTEYTVTFTVNKASDSIN
jgi:hypothetical protein